MKLYDLVDPILLLDHIEKGFVSVQKHPTLPLYVYNYTQKATFENVWGDGTIDYCRGLIVCNSGDRCYEIISRPFKKFHNLNTASIPETLEENLPNTTPTITAKLDGSLGILWQFEGEYGIATRGSFTSPQATWATKWLKDRVNRLVPHYSMDLPTNFDYTWLFEIIYNENRIVVDYPFEDIVLIGIVNKETGVEVPTLEAQGRLRGFRCVGQVKDKNIYDCKADNIPNKEGYVISYARPGTDPLKVKIKMEDYVRLHKIVTGMNPRSIWEKLSTGQDIDSMSSFPEHFQKWFKLWKDKLEGEYYDILTRANQAFAGRPCMLGCQPDGRRWRAEYARYVQKYPQDLHGILFAMFDNRDPAPLIWKQIKPRGDDKAFRTGCE